MSRALGEQKLRVAADQSEHWRKPITVLQTANRIRKVSYLFCLLGIFLILGDYVFGVTTADSSAEPTPRTNPLTFFMILAGLGATLSQVPLKLARGRERVLWLLVIFSASVFPVSDAMTEWVFPGQYLGETGWKTALAMALLAASQLLRRWTRDLALALCVLAIFMPLVTLFGYLMGHNGFVGEMALTTALAILPLGIANLLRFARHRALKPLLRDTSFGRLMRLQLGAWVLVSVSLSLSLGPAERYLGDPYPILQAVELICILALVLYFGARFSRLMDRAARTERALLQDTESDALTGAGSRTRAVSFFLHLTGRTPLGLLLIDLDHFKTINDTYGHRTGDRVLCDAVAALRPHLKLSDELVRWGGEEFLVMMRVPDQKTLMARAECLRASLNDVVIDPEGRHRLSGSIGATLCDPYLAPDLAQCVETADAALYTAKRTGRNRVRFMTIGAERAAGSWPSVQTGASQAPQKSDRAA